MTAINMEKYKSILFDLDGTILNSEPIHMGALSKLLLEENIDISIETLDTDYHGLDDTAVFADLKNKYPALLMNLRQFLEKKNILYTQELQSIEDEKLESLLTPGFRKFLEKIKLSHQVGVVSASEKEVVLSTLERLKILQDFSIIEFRRDGVESKPSPSPYLNTMRELGTNSEETLIFEDSEAGVAAARSSGASVVQISCFTTKPINKLRRKNFKRL